MAAREPRTEVAIEVRRTGGDPRKLKLTLGQLPEGLPPAELPSATGKTAAVEGERPAVGAVPLRLPEFANEVWAYVPVNYDAAVPYGVVMWLHGAGGLKWPDLLARWKPLCDRHDLILVAPKSADGNRWNIGDLALVDRLLTEVAVTYRVDPARVVVHGYQGGGSLAFSAAAQNPDAIRAIAAVEAAPSIAPPENDPLHRLAVYLGRADKSERARAIEAAVAEFRKMKLPITVKNLGDTPRYLNDEELAELARWIDMLDRI